MRIAVASEVPLSGWRQAAIDLGVDQGLIELKIPLPMARIVAEERGRADILVFDLALSPEASGWAKAMRDLVHDVAPALVVVAGLDVSHRIFGEDYGTGHAMWLVAEDHGALLVQRTSLAIFGRGEVVPEIPPPMTGPETDSPWIVQVTESSAPWILRAAAAGGKLIDLPNEVYRDFIERAFVGEGPLALERGRPGMLPRVPVSVLARDGAVYEGALRHERDGGVSVLDVDDLLGLKGYEPSPLDLSWDQLRALPSVAVCAAVLTAQVSSLRRTLNPQAVDTER